VTPITLTAHGFELCEFDDGECETCKTKDPVTWFRSEDYWDWREGSYWCTACATADVAQRIAEDEAPYSAEFKARLWLDGLITLDEAMNL
jgi:hypothetical protein